MYDDIKIKPYPNPDKEQGFSSRFVVGLRQTLVKSTDKNQQEIIGVQSVHLPLSSFQYDQNRKPMGYFVRDMKVNEKGEKIEVTKNKVIQPYISNHELNELVRLAQIVQRPILLKGEPGSGKTQLAKAVAFEWYGRDYQEHFFEWHIKSTTKATDGLYHFDHIARLRNAHLGDKAPIKLNSKGEEDILQYRTFGPMAKAFLTSTPDNPSILLIDEIDKADLDFPNDLLLELDELRFKIPETGEEISALHPPVVFITSNDERELPEAFLRRCLFMFIRFPEKETLKKIIKAHLPGFHEARQQFVENAISRFVKLRDDIEKDATDNKRVSTSELLDWLKAYHYDLEHGEGKYKLDDDRLSNTALENLSSYFHALLKNYASYNREKESNQSRL